MPKRKHPKGKRKAKGPFIAKHPFSSIPKDELIPALVKAGESYRQEFPLLLQEVSDIVATHDPLQIVSFLTTYGLMSFRTDTEIKESYMGDKFNQSHVELAQALAIRNVSISNESPHPGTVQVLFEKLPRLSRAYQGQRMISLGKDISSEERGVRMLQEHLRLHTQTVRNWGFFTRVVKIVREIVAPTDEVFRSALGCSATSLISCFQYLVEQTESRQNARYEKLRAVMLSSSVEEKVQKYFDLHDHATGQPEDLIKHIYGHRLSTDDLKALFLNHSDLVLSESFIFNRGDLAASIDGAENIGAVLDSLSLHFGDLATVDTEHLFLANPVWLKPLIKLDDDHYFCAIPQVFFSFVFQIFDELLKEYPKARADYYNQRARFLEVELKNLFKNVFPNSEVSTNYKWRDGSDEYENDLLVLVDSHLVVVEAKSGAISWPALRGAPDRAKRHVQNLLIAPSIQSLRLTERIYRAIEDPLSAQLLVPNFPFDLGKIHSVLRLSVMLEDFSILQANVHFAKAAGWVPIDHKFAPCMCFSDLQIVFDLLDGSAQKLHYLKRRAELEANMSYLGDELDLLGFYLQTGFNIGEAESRKQHLILTSMSQLIDDYYVALDGGLKPTKPKLRLSKWWADMLRFIEQRKFFRWSDVALIMLSLGYDEQCEVENRFKKIKKFVFKHWKQVGRPNSINIVPPLHKSDAIGFYAYREQERSSRLENISNIASQIFEHEHVKRCVIISVNMDRDHYPYTGVSVLDRPE